MAAENKEELVQRAKISEQVLSFPIFIDKYN